MPLEYSQNNLRSLTFFLKKIYVLQQSCDLQHQLRYPPSFVFVKRSGNYAYSSGRAKNQCNLDNLNSFLNSTLTFPFARCFYFEFKEQNFRAIK